MTDFGRERAWRENELRAERMGRSRRRYQESTSPYREECKWWAKHLAYCESLPGWTGLGWLDTVEAWVGAVQERGEFALALGEVMRLREEAGL